MKESKDHLLVKAEKISYSYTMMDETEEIDIKALDQVDMDVEKGQFICILGSNGSGKSTLARHLNSLLLPDEGTVWIGGMDTKDDEHLWDIRSQVGMVFQNPDNQMVASRADEEVAFGLENLGIPTEQMAERIEEALKYTGMQGFEEENPAYLSGGQKQRLAVAGILAMKPSCIVLDESTAMLDPKGRAEIMDTVIRLNKEQHITLICVTHFMEETLSADRIFVMDHGKIVISGTPQEIFSGKYDLEQAGLKLPVIPEIIRRLREKGMDIPQEVISEDELIRYLKH